MNFFIGLDIGTTGAKSVLINETGSIIATATSEYPMFNPYPLWSEQNPEDWWNASIESLKEVMAKSAVGKNNIKGIGLTGQMHGLVLLDENYKVLRPCIMWNDQRTLKECEEITAKIGFENLLNITGNAALPGFTAPKIIWVMKNEPHIFEKIKHILLPKDFVRFKLTGELAIDVSDASGTSLFDVAKRNWSNEILEKLKIEKSWMPKVFESFEIVGNVKKELSNEIGIAVDTPVVAGGGDQAAGGVGTGTVKDGITSVVLGTSGVVFAATEKFLIEPKGRVHSFCHSVPNKWHVMGVTLSAAGSFKWFKNVLGEYESEIAKQQNKNVYDVLTELAGKAKPGSEGLLFLPYLSGERTPYPDPNAKGSFIGLTLRHDKNSIIRSVLEGVAYSLKDCLLLNEGLGLSLNQVRVSGGGAKSKLWRQILADVLNVELVTLTTTEGAPYGAAILAAVGTGQYSNVEEACARMLKIESGTSPITDNVRIYSDYYEIYENLYPVLKSSFDKITSTVNKYL
jgi:xylulokinase